MRARAFNGWLLEHPIVDGALALVVGVPAGLAIGAILFVALNSKGTDECETIQSSSS